MDVEEEESAESDRFVERADRVDVASDWIVVDLGEGDEGKDEWHERDSDDLALFFRRAVAT